MTTIDRALLGRLRIEPLGRKTHDRAAFSCGVAQVDTYLRNLAAGFQDVDATRLWVACLDDGPGVSGFYAMNAHALDLTTLPEPIRKKLPRYPTVPAIYLSVMGVDQSLQGHGIGKFLLADAMRRAAAIAEQIGAAFMVIDPLNDDAARLYASLKFVELPDQPSRRMLLSMKQVRAAVVASS